VVPMPENPYPRPRFLFLSFFLPRLTCSPLPPAIEVGNAVRALCASLAPQALHLVDAFGVPDHMVQAPIALDWHKFNLVDNQGECVDYLKEEFNL